MSSGIAWVLRKININWLRIFKKRVLDIAVNQINETTDYKIEYEQHKRVEPLLVFIQV